MLFVALISIFLILINPLKLFSIFNPNIFSIIGDQYTHIIDYVNNNILNCKKFTYLTNKPKESIFLDKTLKEYIMNTDSNIIYKRILKDFGNNNEKLCNTVKSFEVDNILNSMSIKEFKELWLQPTQSQQDNRLKAIGDLLKKAEEAKLELTESERMKLETEKTLIKQFKDKKNQLEKDKGTKDFTKKIKIIDMLKDQQHEYLKQTHIDSLENMKKPLKLDDTQYKKFTSFNKIINSYGIIKTNNEDVQIYIYILLCYYIGEIIYDAITWEQVENGDNKYKININEGNNREPFEIVMPGKEYGANIVTIIFGIIILLILLLIQNNNEWLKNSNLEIVYTNKYIPIVLYIIHISCRIIYKTSKYTTYDTYILLKIISIICNFCMCFLIGIWKFSGERINKFIISLIEYPTLILLIPIMIYIIRLNLDYHVKQKHIETNLEMVNEDKKLASDKKELLYKYLSTKVHLPLLVHIISLGVVFILYILKYSNSTEITDKLENTSFIELGEFNKTTISIIVILVLTVLTGLIIYIIDIFDQSTIVSGINNHLFVMIFLSSGIILSIIISIISKINAGETILNPQACLFVGQIAIGITSLLFIMNYSYKLKYPLISSIYCSSLFLMIIIDYIFKNAYGIGKREEANIKTWREEWNLEIDSMNLTDEAGVDGAKVSAEESRETSAVSGETSAVSAEPSPVSAEASPTATASSVASKSKRPRVIRTGLSGRKVATGGSIKESETKNVLLCVILGLGVVIIYKIYQNYKKKKKEKMRGGEVTYEVKPTDLIDKQIMQLIIGIVILLILWINGVFKTADLKVFIENDLLNQSNLNILRLMVFPFIIILIIIIIGGQKFWKSMLLRQIETQSIGNFDADSSSISQSEADIIKKYSNKTLDNKKESDKLLPVETVRAFKYIFLTFIIIWYLYLLIQGRIAMSPILAVNLLIITIYILLIQQVIYVLYKIYMNENINNISVEIDKITEIKKTVKFTKGKINPRDLEEIIEIDTTKFKAQYEEFIVKIYTNIYDMLSINNIYINSAIEYYIKNKLITNKKLEDEYNLSITNKELITQDNPTKLKINGKWVNEKDDNNIILYLFNNIAIIIYLNKTAYNSMKIASVINKDTHYDFIHDTELLFTYMNEKIIINGVNYNRLSNEFSTDNIIKKTLSENDIFKNINYMVSIDRDSKYIGKYNLIEDLTKYNLYKNTGNAMKTQLEEIILNKILLIKAIRDKKYKEANIYNSVLNRLEIKYRKKMKYNKFDTNQDGIIDANELENYKNKNHKLSNPGFVKIKSAIFDGTNIFITFDKAITDITVANANIFISQNDTYNTLRTANNNIVPTTDFELWIDNTEQPSWTTNTIDNTNNKMIDDKTLQLKLSTTILDKMISNNNIEIRIPNTLYITSPSNNPTIRRTLRKTKVKVLKTINNFEEFDASIFGT